MKTAYKIYEVDIKVQVPDVKTGSVNPGFLLIKFDDEEYESAEEAEDALEDYFEQTEDKGEYTILPIYNAKE